MSDHDFMGALYGKGTSPWEVHYLTYSKEMLKEKMLEYGFQIDDFSASPGPADYPWWWCFSGKKVRDL